MRLLHVCLPLAITKMYIKTMNMYGTPAQKKHALPPLAQGEFCAFFFNRVFGFGFVRCKGLRSSCPHPPSPPPFLAKLQACPGAGLQLGKKRGRGGGEFQIGHRTLHVLFALFFCTFHPHTACILSIDAKHIGFANTASKSNLDWKQLV